MERSYGALPFVWSREQTRQNDQRWLAEIIRNSAPFSDWWAKTRIVQLAYLDPANPTLYPGNSTEIAIVETLRHQLRHYCQQHGHHEQEYQRFLTSVDEAYVIETLTCWKRQQFTQAISRNFEIFADREPGFEQIFLVLSTAPISLGIQRQLPDAKRYRALFNVNEFATKLHDGDAQRLTLRTHGYATPEAPFYASFAREAATLLQSPPHHSAVNPIPALSQKHIYVGYHWPSEQPLSSPGIWQDSQRNPGILVKFLLTLSLLAGGVGTLLYLLLLIAIPVFRGLSTLPWISKFWQVGDLGFFTAPSLSWFWIVPTVFFLWWMLFTLLRALAYQRDRYRAIHYGSPDLAEFFWRLDTALDVARNYSAPGDIVRKQQRDQERRLTVNLVGHSMGGLILVNVLRIISDRFGKDDQGTLLPDAMINPADDSTGDIGTHLQIDKLILSSPDIPLEFLREGRNNYVRSAMRRCRRIYLMSSDRDTVLRYLSNLGNWFTEPSMQMSGLRLGNVYLKPIPHQKDEIAYMPYVRIMVHSEAAVQPTSSFELFQKFNYLDCSEMVGGGKDNAGVNAVPWRLNRYTALPIDLVNTVLFFLGVNKLDVHGGYYQTHTPAFRILQFLLSDAFLADEADKDEVVKQKIETLIRGSKIRFLPSTRWHIPQSADHS